MKTAACALLWDGEKILLGKRSSDRGFYPGVWDLVGGHCEPGESPEETLVREAQEELGVTPKTWRPLAVLHDPDPHKHGEYRYHLYQVSTWDGEPRNLQPREHSEIRWFLPAETVGLSLAHPDYAGLFAGLVYKAS